MSDFLQQMAAQSAERAAAAKRHYRDDELDAPRFALELGAFDLIAELKDTSPSAGSIARHGTDRCERARQYAAGGAAAVSVLTEPSRFNGALAHLAEVSRHLAATGIPTMRKDFLVDPVQMPEARAAGASGVLLIAAMLDDRALADLLTAAWDLGMFVLLESFDQADLERTARLLEQPRARDEVQAGRLLAGVNSRNLRTLDLDSGRLRALRGHLPAGLRTVAESGLATADDAAAAARLGYRLALVGTALMRHAQPAELIRDMLRAARASVAA